MCVSEINLEKKSSELSNKNTKQNNSVCENDSPKNELEVNRAKEPLFRKFVIHELDEHAEIPMNELVNNGAEVIRISPVTAKRYLEKMCSKYGYCKQLRRGKTIVVKYKPETPSIDKFSG